MRSERGTAEDGNEDDGGWGRCGPAEEAAGADGRSGDHTWSHFWIRLFEAYKVYALIFLLSWYAK